MYYNAICCYIGWQSIMIGIMMGPSQILTHLKFLLQLIGNSQISWPSLLLKLSYLIKDIPIGSL